MLADVTHGCDVGCHSFLSDFCLGIGDPILGNSGRGFLYLALALEAQVFFKQGHFSERGIDPCCWEQTELFACCHSW